MQFWTFGWLFLSFSEKILYVTRGGTPEIRKETMVLDKVDRVPPEEESWITTPFPIEPAILEALIRVSRKDRLQWDANA